MRKWVCSSHQAGFMMREGKIILDLNKEEKEKMTVDTLRQLFKQNAAESLDNDRMLLQ